VTFFFCDFFCFFRARREEHLNGLKYTLHIETLTDVPIRAFCRALRALSLLVRARDHHVRLREGPERRPRAALRFFKLR
jgi:hypothetical protein